jgi:hypothetical protein
MLGTFIIDFFPAFDPIGFLIFMFLKLRISFFFSAYYRLFTGQGFSLLHEPLIFNLDENLDSFFNFFFFLNLIIFDTLFA